MSEANGEGPEALVANPYARSLEHITPPLAFGLFGVMITVVPFCRRERWAWFTLWFYPVLWVVHLAAQLPPGKDHIHQVVFIVLSPAGLLLPVQRFFSTGRTANTSA